MVRRALVSTLLLLVLLPPAWAESPAQAATAPRISAVSPSAGPMKGGTRIQISGRNLSRATRITVGGKTATGLRRISSSRLSVVVPAWPRPETVRVTAHGAGVASAPTTGARYRYAAAPTISKLSPATVVRGSAKKVTLSGRNFIGTTKATVAGRSVAVTRMSSTTLHLEVPAQTKSGNVPVKVRTAGGWSGAFQLGVADPPRLLPGQALALGQMITAPDGSANLKMQTDGNLVMRLRDGRVVWATSTVNKGYRVVMQHDGNLVVYTRSGAPVWATDTDGFPGARLVFSGTSLRLQSATGQIFWTSTLGRVFDRLLAGQALGPDERLVTLDRSRRLLMQRDGNLVLYPTAGSALWATATEHRGYRAIMQGDGNLVVRNRSGQPVWATDTDGFPGAQLRITGDAVRVETAAGQYLWTRHRGKVYNQLLPGQTLVPDATLESLDRRFRLIMQRDGNLVLYRKGSGATWSTATVGRGYSVGMQGDGNLVVRSSSGAPVWASGTDGHPQASLSLSNEGVLSIRASAGNSIWSSDGSTGGALETKVDDFVRRWDGKYVDVDGFPKSQPYQCTDLFNKFHSELMGGSYVRMRFSGGAKDLWSTDNSNEVNQKYSRVDRGQGGRKGDVAVWDGAMGGGYGHVAIVLSDRGEDLEVLTQNPGATKVSRISKAHLLGYLRPRM